MSTEQDLPKIQKMRVEDIQPYENNPRKISKEAVEAVKGSISRYGYVQPIAVDKNGVIVVGHTRHRALRDLGVEETEVYVLDLPEEKIREYRLADNRAGELSDWDMDSLIVELREWETGLIEDYFPDVDLEVGHLEEAQVTNEDVDWASDKISATPQGMTHALIEVECPSCYGAFKVKAASMPGLSFEDLQVLTTRMERTGTTVPQESEEG